MPQTEANTEYLNGYLRNRELPDIEERHLKGFFGYIVSTSYQALGFKSSLDKMALAAALLVKYSSLLNPIRKGFLLLQTDQKVAQSESPFFKLPVDTQYLLFYRVTNKLPKDIDLKGFFVHVALTSHEDLGFKKQSGQVDLLEAIHKQRPPATAPYSASIEPLFKLNAEAKREIPSQRRKNWRRRRKWAIRFAVIGLACMVGAVVSFFTGGAATIPLFIAAYASLAGTGLLTWKSKTKEEKLKSKFNEFQTNVRTEQIEKISEAIPGRDPSVRLLTDERLIKRVQETAIRRAEDTEHGACCCICSDELVSDEIKLSIQANASNRADVSYVRPLKQPLLTGKKEKSESENQIVWTRTNPGTPQESFQVHHERCIGLWLKKHDTDPTNRGKLSKFGPPGKAKGVLYTLPPWAHIDERLSGQLRRAQAKPLNADGRGSGSKQEKQGDQKTWEKDVKPNFGYGSTVSCSHFDPTSVQRDSRSHSKTNPKYRPKKAVTSSQGSSKR